MMSKIVKTTKVIGIKSVNAANPNAGNSAIRICSDPYAEDEMQSDERMPRA
jgi:hypothetical protein